MISRLRFSCRISHVKNLTLSKALKSKRSTSPSYSSFIAVYSDSSIIFLCFHIQDQITYSSCQNTLCKCYVHVNLNYSENCQCCENLTAFEKLFIFSLRKVCTKIKQCVADGYQSLYKNIGKRRVAHLQRNLRP